MDKKPLDDEIFEALLRQVVNDNMDREIDQLELESKAEGPFPFSKRHEERMRKLFDNAAGEAKVKYLTKTEK